MNRRRLLNQERATGIYRKVSTGGKTDPLKVGGIYKYLPRPLAIRLSNHLKERAKRKGLG